MKVERILSLMGAARRSMGRALMEAVPAPEPHCIHNCGPGYCPVKGCPHG